MPDSDNTPADNSKADGTAAGRAGWQPIETAPRDEKAPILVWFDHDADTYRNLADPMKLTDYATNAESGDYLAGHGIAMAVWREGYHESDGWEAANSYWVPGGWFAWLDGDAADQAVNATHWMPLPNAPAAAEVPA